MEESASAHEEPFGGSAPAGMTQPLLMARTADKSFKRSGLGEYAAREAGIARSLPQKKK
jgi:hypothetical protein